MKYNMPFKVIGIQFRTIDRELTDIIPLTITEEGTIKPKYYFIHDDAEFRQWKTKLSDEFCTQVFKEKYREIEKIKIKYLIGKDELV